MLRGPATCLLRATTDVPVSKGQVVTAMIRPERLRLRTTDHKATAENCIQARIEEKVFLGEATKYHASVSPGHTFVCKTLTTASASSCGAGDDVVLEVEAESIIILCDTSSVGTRHHSDA